MPTHTPSLRRRTLLGALAATPLSWAATAATTDWPRKPIKLVVTFPPGGSSDLVARLLAPALGEQLGQPVVIENKPGAGSSIGAQQVAQSPADGYTLLASNSAALSIAPSLLEKRSYDPSRSFVHLAYIGAVPTVFALHPSVPAHSIEALAAWIRSQPGALPFGSGGAASVGHLVGEQFAQALGLKLQHVPYKGAGPMRSDLLGGQIRMAVDALPQNIPLQQQGRIKLLAVTSARRVPQAPNTPTVAELGYAQLESENYVGISAPAGVPAGVAARISQAVRQACLRPAIAQALQAQGFATQDMEPAAFAHLVAAQSATWGRIAQRTGATL
ncbi:Bug family tripartite tricarboxylate transporter substrate binding protein [Comamonas sp. GB3 AK4-5]|uniref:Bug family tripartite tricarboxylate transporter substrate binding protein n=1 Tax=Comamonas sp. GB3 AK4-5 TaxID=3231487 RepID=UPI00351F4E37